MKQKRGRLDVRASLIVLLVVSFFIAKGVLAVIEDNMTVKDWNKSIPENLYEAGRIGIGYGNSNFSNISLSINEDNDSETKNPPDLIQDLLWQPEKDTFETEHEIEIDLDSLVSKEGCTFISTQPENSVVEVKRNDLLFSSNISGEYMLTVYAFHSNKSVSGDIRIIVGKNEDSGLDQPEESNVSSSDIEGVAENVTDIGENSTGINDSDVSRQVNITSLSEYDEQGIAVINQPVAWKKTVRSQTLVNGTQISLAGAINYSITMIDGSERAVNTREIVQKKEEGKSAGESIKQIIVEDGFRELEIEYYTQGPESYEEDVPGGKKVTISSGVHYTSIQAYSDVPGVPAVDIMLYHIENNTLVPVSFTVVDKDDDGLIERIMWVVPHLSTQVYQISFRQPTLSHKAITYNNYAIINVSVNASSLSQFRFNWNGTNYTIYNISLVCRLNFDNVSSLSECTTRGQKGCLKDISLKQNNGTLGNSSPGSDPSWVSNGKYGGAFYFDGNDRITVNNSKNLNFSRMVTNFTIGMWINTNCTNCSIFTLDYIGFDRLIYLNNSGNICQRVWNDQTICTTGKNYADNRWHYVVQRMDNFTGQSIFVDGISVANGSRKASDFTWARTAFIGYAMDAQMKYFIGRIDEFSIWNRSLSNQEIYEMYASNLGRTGPDTWNFYINQSRNATLGLSNGLYSYSAFAADSLGGSNTTGKRFLSVGDDYSTSDLEYLSPTPSNNSVQSNRFVRINVSISEPNLKELKFNWNGTNFTIYNDSLVLMMNFDNVSELGEDGTYVVDLGREGNDGTVNGPVWKSLGKFGGAFEFDGDDDYINCGNDSSFNMGSHDFTVSAWINTTVSSGYNLIISKGSCGGGGKRYNLWGYRQETSSSALIIDDDTGCGAPEVHGSTHINDGKWHHITGVKDGNYLRIYIDGKEDSTPTDISTCGPIDDTVRNLTIGVSSCDGTSYNFNGTIDEVRVWNRSLSSEEIYEQYASNLNKVNQTHWNLYVNQSMNSTVGLSEGTYTYQVFAKDTNVNSNSTQVRQITISYCPENMEGTGTQDDPCMITDCSDLQAINESLTYFYALNNSVNCNISPFNHGEGFIPIGNGTQSFKGDLDGRNLTINGLFINRSTGDNQGLFGSISNATLRNVGLTNVSILARYRVGALVARPTNHSLIENCYAIGIINSTQASTTGYSQMGGLVGATYITNIKNSYASVDVYATGYRAGGFVGQLWRETTDAEGTSVVENCYSTGNVIGDSSTGGFVGYCYGTTINNSFSLGNVTRNTGEAATTFGGFVGYNTYTTIKNSYSIGSVFYAGAAAPTDKGFCGDDIDTAQNNFFDSSASNQDTATGATAKTTQLMKNISTFSSWSISATQIDQNDGYPYHAWKANITNYEWIIYDPAPKISFVSPTPSNATSQITRYARPNISITESNLKEIKYNWNGTNFTMYNDSLVLMLNFDDWTRLNDTSRNANHGNCTSCPVYVSDGKHGGAYNFTAGNNDHIDCGNDSSLSFGAGKSFSYSLWFRWDSNQTGWKGLIYHDSAAKSQGHMGISDTGKLSAGTGDGSTWQTHQSSYAVPIGSWVHAVVTMNRVTNTMVIYANGINVGNWSHNYVPNAATVGLRIGEGNVGGEYFDGKIDEVRIWNRSLTAAEVYQQYVSNLQKINSTHWNMWVNQSRNATTSLSDGTYSYQVFAKDTNNFQNSTEKRVLTISSDIIHPILHYLSPTPTNATTQSARYVRTNISITESNLKEIKYDWNGTNFTLYNKSLVLMLNFDNVSALGESSTHAADISLYGNNATIYGSPAWNETGVYGRTLNFDGVDDRIDIADHNSLDIGANEDFSFTFWLRFDGTYQRFVTKKIIDTADTGWGFWLGSPSYTVHPSMCNGATCPYTATIDLDDSNWHFVAITIDRDGNCVNYRDANITNITDCSSWAATDLSNSRVVRFGTDIDDSDYFFHGDVDSFALWNRSLTKAEVYQQYASNLQKINSTYWNLYVNQSKNATTGLSDGTYSYQVFAKDTSNLQNSTEKRFVTVTNGYGSSEVPAVSCAQILASGNSTGDGLYWIDPDGSGPIVKFSVYCDMTSADGPWTLVAKKTNAQVFKPQYFWSHNYTPINYSSDPTSSTIYKSWDNLSFSSIRIIDHVNGFDYSINLTNSSMRAQIRTCEKQYVNISRRINSTLYLDICRSFNEGLDGESFFLGYASQSSCSGDYCALESGGYSSFDTKATYLNSDSYHNNYGNVSVYVKGNYTGTSQSVTSAQRITFASPTPANASSQSARYVQINATIVEPDLASLKYNWNGTNFTLYNRSLLLKLDMDRLSSEESINATFSMSTSGNSYVYYDLTSVSDYVVQSGDYLEYDVFWDSSAAKIAFDYTTSDETALRGESTANDQYGLNAHPNTLLSSRALKQWYHRRIPIPATHVGKTIQYYDIVCESDTSGRYTGYLDNIRITDGNGTTRKNIYNNGSFTSAAHTAVSGSLVTLSNTSKGPFRANDSSMHAINGTVYSAQVISSGKYGGALSFDGSNDLVAISSTYNLTNGNLSASAWVNLDSASEDGAFIKIGDSSTGFGIGVGASTFDDSGNNLIMLYEGIRWIDTNVNIGTGWHHVAMVVDKDGEPSGYIDGKKVYSDTLNSDGLVPKGNVTYIGGYAARYVDSYIDEVMIWNRSLTKTEVYEIYATDIKRKNQTHWTLWANQSKNSTASLSEASYDYQIFAKDSLNNQNKSEKRYVTISLADACVNLDDTSTFGTKIRNNSLGYFVNSNITLCTRTYNKTKTVLMANSSNIIIDCDGSMISGALKPSTKGISATLPKVTIQNCVFYRTYTGVYSSAGSTTVLNNSFVQNNRGYECYSCQNSSVKENYFASSQDSNIYASDGKYNNFTNNTIRLAKAYDIYFTGKSQGNRIYDNLINSSASKPIKLPSSQNLWNRTSSAGQNIVGGQYMGGNFYANILGTGYSQKCADSDLDSICDDPYMVFNANNYDYLPLAITSGMDHVPPSVTIVSPSNNTFVNGNVSVYVSATDNTGIKNVVYRVKNSTISNVTICNESSSPYSCTWHTRDYADSSEGYDLSATAYDYAGNTASYLVHFTIDRSIPYSKDVQAVYPPGRSSVRDGQRFSLKVNVSDSEDVGAGINTTEVSLVYLNSSGNVTMVLGSGSRTTGHWSLWNTSLTTSLATSGYSYAPLYVYDNATPLNNIRSSDRFFVYLDNTAPTYANMTNTDAYDDEQVYLTLNAFDDHLLDRVILSTNFSGTWVNETAQTLSYNAYPVSFAKTATSGILSYKFFIFDEAGNSNETAVGSFSTMGPRPQFTVVQISPEENSVFSSASANLTFKYYNGEGVNCSLFIDNILNFTIQNPLNMTVLNFTRPIADGTYSWYVSCFDNITNSSSATSARGFTVDLSAPVVSILYPSETTYASLISDLSFNYAENNPYDCYYSLDGGITNTSIPQCKNLSEVSYSQGHNNLTLYVKDLFGNVGSDSVNFTLDSSYGSWNLNMTNLTEYMPSPAIFYFNITFSDAHPGMYIFSWYNMSEWVNDSAQPYLDNVPASVTKNVTVPTGTINWTWYYNDSFGHRNKTPTWSKTLTYRPVGLGLRVVYPQGNINVTQFGFFNVTLNVTCLNQDCGTVNVSLDPSSQRSVVVWELGDAADYSSGSYAAAQQVATSMGITFNTTASGNSATPPVYSHPFWTKDIIVTSAYTYNYPSGFNYSAISTAFSGGKTIIMDRTYFNQLKTDYGFTDVNYTTSFPCLYTPYILDYMCHPNGGMAISDFSGYQGCDWEGACAVTVGNGFAQLINTSPCASIKSGTVSIEAGTTPFYTNKSRNPYNISLNNGQSQLVTFYVNATGNIGSTHLFNAYANLTSDTDISNMTSFWNVTISDLVSPSWSQNLTNLTVATAPGQSAYFNITISERNPGKYVFSWYNGSVWRNDSAVSYTDGQKVKVNKTIKGRMINWTWYINDSYGNRVKTDVWSKSLYYQYGLGLQLIYPSGSITVDRMQYFNVTMNITCLYLDCGKINVTLDPAVGTAYNFTTCSATGTAGPSQTSCNTAYSGKTLSGQVTVTSGIQRWTVPQTGTYRITAAGAKGDNGDYRTAGYGAKVSGTFILQKGEIINILVGQVPSGNDEGGGGGGGTYVIKNGPDGTPDDVSDILVIAGGGGGAAGNNPYSNGNGGIAARTASTTGTAGNGGAADSGYSNERGAGGGGFTGDGSSISGTNGGKSFVNGGAGGSSYGGFGGGGSLYSDGAGGGGGYSGGNGNDQGGGYGGSSYNSGTYQINTSGANNAAGFVNIMLLSSSKSIISTVSNATPFATNKSRNPYNISLTSRQSQVVMFHVNATGDINSTYEFFAFVNMTTNMSVNNRTIRWNVTIADLTAPSWSGNKTNLTNGTGAGSRVYFNVTVTERSPSHYIFSWYNGSVWRNDSAQRYNDSRSISVVKTINSNNVTVNWTWYINDTSKNWVKTDVWSKRVFAVYALSLKRVYPLSDIDVERLSFFNVTVNVTCLYKDCGQVNVSLDPYTNYKVAVWETGDSGDYNNGAKAVGQQLGTSIGAVLNTSVSGYSSTTPKYSNGFWNNNILILSGSLNYPSGYNYSAISTAFRAGQILIVKRSYFNQLKSVYNLTELHYNSTFNCLRNPYELDYICDNSGGMAITDDSNYMGCDWEHGCAASVGNAFAQLLNTSPCSAVSVKGGLIRTIAGTTPFYTNKSANPHNLTLSSGQSGIITFFVNATGPLDHSYEFYAYSNITGHMSVGNITSHWNVTIKDMTDPAISFGETTTSAGKRPMQTYVIANITASDAYLDKVRVYLYNSTGLVNMTTHTSGAYLRYNDLKAGVYYINATANDTSGNNATLSSRMINLTEPTIRITRVYPQTNIDAPQKRWFNVTVNVTCMYEDCGNVSVSLDPYSNYKIAVWETGDSGDYNNGAKAVGQQVATSIGATLNTSASGYSYTTPVSSNGFWKNNILILSGSVNYPSGYNYSAVSGAFAAGKVLIIKRSYLNQLKTDYGLTEMHYNTSFPCLRTPYELDYICHGSGGIAITDDDSYMGCDWEHGCAVSIGNGFAQLLNSSPCSAVSSKGGLVSTTVGATPFFTNKSANPYIVSLNKSNSTIVTFFVNATGSVGGVYEFYAYATVDAGENITNQTTRWNVTITDINPPTINYGQKTTSSGNLSQSYIRVNVTADDNNFDNITIYLYNASGLKNHTSTTQKKYYVQFNDLPAGTYRINATAFDTSDNAESVTTRIITLDTSSPAISIVSPADLFNATSSSVNFTFSITDNSTNNCSVYIDQEGSVSYLPRSTNSSSRSGSTITLNVSGIAQRRNMWYIRCVDAAGNSNTTTPRRLTVDTSAPLISFDTPTENQSTGYLVYIRTTVSDSLLSVDDSWYYILNTSNRTQVLFQGKLNYTGSWDSAWDTTAHNDVMWNVTLVVYANDTLGNMANDNVSFYLDNVKPVIQLITPPKKELFYSSNFTMDMVAQDASLNYTYYNITNSSGDRVQHNSSIYATSTSRHAWQDIVGVSVLPDGIYNITVFAEDTAKNNRTESARFYVDANAPKMTLNDPEAGAYLSSSSVVFNWTAKDNVSAWMGCNISVGAATRTLTCGNSSPCNVTFSSFQSQTYNFTVYCRDNASNVALISSNITVDLVLPKIGYAALTSTAGNISQDYIYVLLNLSESNNRNTTIKLYDSSGSLAGSAFTTQRSVSSFASNFTSLADGLYTVNASINDSAGHFNKTLSRAIYLDTTNPVARLYANDSLIEYKAEGIYVNWTANDSNLRSRMVNITSEFGPSVFSSQLVSGSVVLSPANFSNVGNYTISVYAEDNAGNSNSTYFAFTVNDTLYPTLTMTGSVSGNISGDFIFVNVSTSDHNLRSANVYLYFGSSLINQSITAFSPNTINFTSLADGLYHYNASACDEYKCNRSQVRYVLLDDTIPKIEFGEKTSNFEARSQDYIFVNASGTETNTDLIRISIFNSSNELVNTTTSSSFPLTINFTSLKDDTYYINASVNDTSKNYNRTSIRTLILDAVYPRWESNATNMSASTVVGDYVYFNLTIIEKNPDLYIFSFYNGSSWENDTAQTYQNGTVISASKRITASTISYMWFFNDTTGNRNQTPPYSFTVDDSSPSAAITINDSDAEYGYDSVMVNWSASDANLGAVTFNITYPGGAVLFSASSALGSINLSPENISVKGRYNISLLALDLAGNFRSSSSAITVNDTIYPAINFSSHTTGEGNRTQYWISINVTASDHNLTNITIFMYNSTGTYARESSVSSPYFVNYSSLPLGRYYINATACDGSGNCNSTETRSVLVLTSSPSVSLNLPRQGYYNDTSVPPTITFNCSAADPDTLTNISLFITDRRNLSLKLNQTTNISNVSNSSSWQISLYKGNYTWNCLSNDIYYHAGWGENRTIMINYTAASTGRITGCEEVTQKGSYSLEGNITTSEDGTCITVSADDVDIDCDGKYIIASGSLPDIGIKVQKSDSGIRNITIRNCSIYNFNENGVYMSSANSSRLVNVTVNGSNTGVQSYGGRMNSYHGLRITSERTSLQLGSESRSNVTGSNFTGGLVSGLFVRDSSYIFADKLSIRDFGGGGYYEYEASGIHASRSKDIKITDSNLTSCFVGFWVEYSNSTNLTRARSDNNLIGAYYIDSKRSAVASSSLCSDVYGFASVTSGDIILRNSTVKDSAEVGIYIDDYQGSSGTVKVYDNLLNNSYNVYLDAISRFNTSYSSGINIMGQSYIGGNYWTNPTATGYSDTCKDANGDRICNDPYLVGRFGGTDYYDHLPLAVRDMTSPTLEFYSPRNNSYVNGNVTLRTVPSDDSGGISHVLFEYKNSSVGFTQICNTTSSPYDCSWDVSSLSDGAGYTIRATAFDASLNNASRIMNYTIDKSMPYARDLRVIYPENQTSARNSQPVMITLEAKDSQDSGAGLNHTLIELAHLNNTQGNTTMWLVLGSKVTGSWSQWNISVVIDNETGIKNVTLHVLDNATPSNNVRSSETAYVRIDNILPYYSGIKNKTPVFNNENFSVVLNMFDNYKLKGYIFSTNMSGSWSNDSFVNLSSSRASIRAVKNATSGNHSFRFYIYDDAGNVNVTRDYDFRIYPDQSYVTDTDGDGVYDNEDNLNWNLENVSGEGASGLNIRVDGSSDLSSYDGRRQVVFYNSTDTIMNFTHNFSASKLDLANITINLSANYLIVNMSGQLSTNKSLYIKDNNFVALCVKDAPIIRISNMTSSCTGPNETDFSSCLGNSSIVHKNGLVCEDLGTRIKVSNLRHSAMRGTPATPASAPVTTIASSPSGGAGSIPIRCGDGICLGMYGETCSSCPEDCGECEIVKGGGNISEEKPEEGTSVEETQKDRSNDEIPLPEEKEGGLGEYGKSFLGFWYVWIILLMIVMALILFYRKTKEEKKPPKDQDTALPKVKEEKPEGDIPPKYRYVPPTPTPPAKKEMSQKKAEIDYDEIKMRQSREKRIAKELSKPTDDDANGPAPFSIYSGQIHEGHSIPEITYVLLFNSKGELALQKTLSSEEDGPAITAFREKVRPGESPKETALRKIKKSIGISPMLFFFSKDIYSSKDGPDKVLIAYKAIITERQEAGVRFPADVSFYSLKDIMVMVDEGQNFNPELKLILEKLIRSR